MISFMNKSFSLLLPFTLILFAAHAQEQLPNMDFENWEEIEVGVDDPPNEFKNEFQVKVDSIGGGVWGSANTLLDTLDDIYIQPFMKDTAYSYSGNKAVLLRTQMIGPIPATGTLWTGSIGKAFDISKNLFGAKTGVSFQSTPSNFKGYYDYKSVQGDTCIISCYLTNWNEVTNERDTVGHGKFMSNETTEGFKQFDIPIFYNSMSPSVDSVTIIMLSSFGGTQFRGRAGSTLIVDNTSFDYAALAYNVNNPIAPFDVDITSSSGKINIKTDHPIRNAKVEIYEMNGKKVHSENFSVLKEESININSNQLLIVKIENGKYKVNRKVVARP